jgi:Domain of unknown function (DUF4440)
MPRSFIVVLAAVSLGTSSRAMSQSQSAEAEVLGVVKAMLAVIETKDAASVAAYVDSTTRFTLLRPTPTGGRVIVIAGPQFIERVTQPGGPPAKELIRNPEVRVDGELATVWTEYQFIIDGKVHHCGHDAFHLGRIGGTWKILNVSDSYREQGCGEPWPGGN